VDYTAQKGARGDHQALCEHMPGIKATLAVRNCSDFDATHGTARANEEVLHAAEGNLQVG
jgi:hypothetical protein